MQKAASSLYRQHHLLRASRIIGALRDIHGYETSKNFLQILQKLENLLQKPKFQNAIYIRQFHYTLYTHVFLFMAIYIHNVHYLLTLLVYVIDVYKYKVLQSKLKIKKLK